MINYHELTDAMGLWYIIGFLLILLIWAGLRVTKKLLTAPPKQPNSNSGSSKKEMPSVEEIMARLPQ